MSKQNFSSTTTPDLVGHEEITAEQRARISQKFRAAKALRARKRPRTDSLSFHHHHHENTSAVRFETPVDRNKRVPLKDISVNTPSQIYLNTIQLVEDKYISGSSCKGKYIEGTNLVDNGYSTKTACSIENECASDSFITPLRLKQPESFNSGGSFPTPSLLDEDEMDESILEEIDALCREQSAAKVDSNAPNTDSNLCMENQYTDNRSGDLSILMDLVAASEDKRSNSMDYLDGLEYTEEKICTSRPITNESMPEEFSKYLHSLNDRQLEAACGDIATPLMIIAGPGSGKTSTMVGRILMLINEGISPSNILAMTFTTAAASEMRDRVGAVVGKSTAKEVTISTFHSFSLQLCRSHAEKIGRTSEFLIYGHGQQRRAIIEAVRLLEDENRPSHDVIKLGQNSNGISSLQYFKDKSKKWLKFVTQAKASGRTPAECRKMGDEIGATILRNYENILSSCNALDYHDLISCSVKLLTDFPEVFEESQNSWKAIVVDEFQDTSAMQYSFLRVLASHNRITIVGDDDQSIFSFNGADISGFDSFRKDFPNNKEIRLNKNYRSTRIIVEAASYLIQNNMKRCRLKNVQTDNSSGSKITIKECQNEDAQCAFVVDKILETTSKGLATKCSYGNIAILYRRQVSGKVFQTAFRDRKIPFNVHGVAFYRKKVVKAIISMLRTAVPDCDDGPYRQVFKALLPFEIEEKKRVIGHIEKISTTRKCSFISAACEIFGAKISGTFKRSQLTQGRKVLLTLETISKLVHREQSISAVIISVGNMLPQKYLLEQRAVVDVDSGKLLNEDNDLRSVLQYLQDDIANFLSNQSDITEEEKEIKEEKGCIRVLKAFIDFLNEREKENFRSRRHDNENSVTLTTIHQSKGLEWDVVFIVKANDSEIPLLHEFNGVAKENATSVEEERRLLYVAMTRARKKLFILYVMMDPNWQMLQPSRFLKEIPDHLLDIQAEISIKDLGTKHENIPNEMPECGNLPEQKQSPKSDTMPSDFLNIQNGDSEESTDLVEPLGGNSFLKRFIVEERSVVSHLFHQWAKKQAFQDPKRLLVKVGFVIDERLRVKKNKHKDVLLALKSCLSCDEAFQYAEYVLRWEQIPADQRANMMREKQEHFLKLRMENSMGSSAPTPKQIAYLQSLGCTVTPTSRLHASRLIEQYKAL